MICALVNTLALIGDLGKVNPWQSSFSSSYQDPWNFIGFSQILGIQSKIVFVLGALIYSALVDVVESGWPPIVPNVPCFSITKSLGSRPVNNRLRFRNNSNKFNQLRSLIRVAISTNWKLAAFTTSISGQ